MERAPTAFRPTRSKGQCFLEDPYFIERIVDAIAPARDEPLVEIGAGRGQLTFPVLARGARVVAVEADRRLAEPLATEAPEELAVVQADAIRVDWDELVDRTGQPTVRAYGNLPYSVAAPILLHLLASANRFESLVFMFQREVAMRLTAHPSTRDYSFLTVVAQQAAVVEQLFDVPPGAFRPRPRVVSTVVSFRLLHDAAPDVGDPAIFRAVVKGLLAHRRKTIANNVKRLSQGPVASEALDAAIAEAGLDPTARAETLSVSDFARVSQICTSQA